MASVVSKQKSKAVSLLLIQLLFEDDKEEKKRRGPDRQWIKRRNTKGAFQNIFKELAVEDTQSFTSFMRMNYQSFKSLVDAIAPQVVKKSTKMRSAISVSERVALTIRFLATGESFRSLEYQSRISRRAISYIVLEVCRAIYSEFSGSCLTFPKYEDEWRQIERQFSRKWHFPHSVGALDGKHIVMEACGSGSYYYNYKGTHSIVLMVLAGPDYQIIWCNAGVNGRVADGGVWNESELGKALENGHVKLPPAEPLPDRTVNCPFVIIGDDAFALKTYLMKPYPQQNLDNPKRVCNYRFSRARRVVENVFGILANRWRVFRSPIALMPENVEAIVMATVTLHNWLLKNGNKEAYAPQSLVDCINPSNGCILPGLWRNDAEATNL